MDLKKLIYENLSDKALMTKGAAISEKFKNTAKNVGSSLINTADSFFDALSYGIVKYAFKDKSKNKNTVRPVSKNTNYNNLKPEKNLSEAFYTNLTEGQNKLLKKGDSVADILAKMLNFMKKVHEEEIKESELARNLAKKNRYVPVGKEKEKSIFTKMEKQEEEGIPWWQKLLAGLTAALGILGSIYDALRGIFSPLGSFFKKLVFKPVPKTPPPEEKPASEKDRESEREKEEKKREQEKREQEKQEERNRRLRDEERGKGRGSRPEQYRNIAEQPRDTEGRGKSSLFVDANASKQTSTRINDASRLYNEILSDPEAQRSLNRSGITFNEKTSQFRKPKGFRITAEEVAKKIGKPELMEKIKPPTSNLESMGSKLTEKLPEKVRGNLNTVVEGLKQYFGESAKNVAAASESWLGKGIKFVTNSAAKLIVIYAIVKIAQEIFEVLFDNNLSQEQKRNKVMQLIVGAMTLYGVDWVVFTITSAATTALTGAVSGPLALIAGPVSGLAGVWVFNKAAGSEIDKKAQELTDYLIKMFLENSSESPSSDIPNVNEQSLPGGEFFDPSTMIQGNKSTDILKSKAALNVGSLANGSLANMMNQYAMNKTTTKMTQPIVINQPAVTNTIGSSQGSSGVSIASSATIRNQERTLNNALENSIRPV